VEVDELEDVLHGQVNSKRLGGGGHQNHVVIEVLVELLDVHLSGLVPRKQLELQSVVSRSHLPDVVEEDAVGF